MALLFLNNVFREIMGNKYAIGAVSLLSTLMLCFEHNSGKIIKVAPKGKQKRDKNVFRQVVFFYAAQVDCRKHLVRRLPCNLRDCSYYKLQYIILYINSAKRSLDLCMYLITCTDLAKALIKIHESGINVRIIVEEEMSTSSESKTQMLIDAGIKLKSKKLSTFMHHKFCIIDSEDPINRKVMTGSLNWTLQGLAGNWENIIVTSETSTVYDYHTEFNEIWKYFISKK